MKMPLLGFAFLSLTAGCANTLTNQDNTTQSATTAKVKYLTYIKAGDPFPVTSMENIKGQSIDLTKSSKRKLVFLFATWCSDSKRALTELLDSPISKDSSVEIIGIGREESTDTLAEFKQNWNIAFPLVADPKREIYGQVANAGVPRLIVLDANNQVTQTLIGEAPNSIEKLHL